MDKLSENKYEPGSRVPKHNRDYHEMNNLRASHEFDTVS